VRTAGATDGSARNRSSAARVGSGWLTRIGASSLDFDRMFGLPLAV
jgi:hypothetical protein